VGGAEHQAGLRATADLLQAQAERARQSLAHIAAAAAAAQPPPAGGAGAAAVAAPLAWAAEQLGHLSAALGGLDGAGAVPPPNPLVQYIYPQTAAMFDQSTLGAAAFPLPGQLPQQVSQVAQKVSQVAQSIASTPPEQLIMNAQAMVTQQAERLGAAAAAASMAGRDTSSSTTTNSPSSTSSSSTTTSSSSSSMRSASAEATAAPTVAAAAASSSSSREKSELVGEWASAHDDAGLLRAEELSFSAVSSPAAAAAAPAAAHSTQPAQPTSSTPPQQQQAANEPPPRPVLRERRVPSTPIGRAFGFASMGASLLLGTLKDNIVSTFSGPGPDTAAAGSSGGSGSGGAYNIITEANAERLAAALCRMRGAALKLGQMISIQDDTVLPPQVRCDSCSDSLVVCLKIVLCMQCCQTPTHTQKQTSTHQTHPNPTNKTQIQSALERVRQGADVMPRAQLEGQLVAQLGRDWQDKLQGGFGAECTVHVCACVCLFCVSCLGILPTAVCTWLMLIYSALPFHPYARTHPHTYARRIRVDAPRRRQHRAGALGGPEGRAARGDEDPVPWWVDGNGVYSGGCGHSC
jgi:hypothetical protein